MTKICKNCDNKGYSTILQGYTIAPDFEGDERYTETPTVRVKICKHCSRGKEIRKYFDVKKGREALFI